MRRRESVWSKGELTEGKRGPAATAASTAPCFPGAFRGKFRLKDLQGPSTVPNLPRPGGPGELSIGKCRQVLVPPRRNAQRCSNFLHVFPSFSFTWNVALLLCIACKYQTQHCST